MPSKPAADTGGMPGFAADAIAENETDVLLLRCDVVTLHNFHSDSRQVPGFVEVLSEVLQGWVNELYQSDPTLLLRNLVLRLDPGAPYPGCACL
ncbi:hypothetical protein D3C84_1136800 [compost metagenome]